MSVEYKLEKVVENHPNRCNGKYTHGQCPYKAIEGSDYCPLHGGVHTLHKQQRESTRSYNLAKWQSRVDGFVDSPSLKTLREEIGIARMVLESILVRCSDAMDLMLNSNKINQLLERIEKLVIACDRLDTKLAFSLDKSTAINLAEQIVQIIAEQMPESVDLDSIAIRISQSILVAGRIDQSNGSQ